MDTDNGVVVMPKHGQSGFVITRAGVSYKVMVIAGIILG